MDFTRLRPKSTANRLVDPIELFQNHKVTDPSINDLWLAQGDALRNWHHHRDLQDIGIVLNTGAGKTLVGLLIAQSLVNEVRRHVLYACSSIQLVQQTAEKAHGYGLPATTYFKQEFSNDGFHKLEAPCITTYQALFNGRSKFFDLADGAIIFDDAHTAEHLLRDQFSLRIDRDKFGDLYSSIVGLFAEYHRRVGRAASYKELATADSDQLFLVPPFELRRQFSEFVNLLSQGGLNDVTDTTFAWAHLKDHLHLCAVLIDATTVTVTPPFVPVRSLPYFQGDTRRVYLSATLAAEDAFARTFGKKPDLVVAPETTAGECERMIVMASQVNSLGQNRERVKETVNGRKALILVPAHVRARAWNDVAQHPRRAEVTAAVNAFKVSSDPVQLVLAARYDGVDLPGDTCRVMIFDGLPMGVGPLERFMWSYIRLSNSLRSVVASRIVQSFGRISRGMSDHGVVVIVDDRLSEWLMNPRNLAALPAFLQKQLKLGYELSGQLQTVEEVRHAIYQCLERDPEWIEAYDRFIKDSSAEIDDTDVKLLSDVACGEADYALHMWNGDFTNAAQALAGTLEKAFDVSRTTGAWHSLWLGAAHELTGDADTANEMYRKAHSAQRNIPAVIPAEDSKETTEACDQALEIEQQIPISKDGQIIQPKGMDVLLNHLDGTGSTAQIEEALRALGELLGLESSRPEKEGGTGPDVLWTSPGLPALCMEAKTDKANESSYTKHNIGQLMDHIQWVKNNTDVTEIIPIFVGPLLPASKDANPSAEILVVELRAFDDLSKKLMAVYQDIISAALPITLRATVDEYLAQRHLLWPSVLKGMSHRRLVDIES